MALDLSIIVPTTDNIVEGKFYHKIGGGEVFRKGNVSLWGTVIYEIWSSYSVHSIYTDISDRIKDLTSDIEYADYHKDFSKKTQDELEAEKNRITEGVKILLNVGYPTEELYHNMSLLLDTAERYVNKRIRIEKTVELVEQLELRIKQLQIDAQTGDFRDIKQFKKEMEEIKKEIKFLKNFGANKKEMERLRRLARYAKKDIRDLEEQSFFEI